MRKNSWHSLFRDATDACKDNINISNISLNNSRNTNKNNKVNIPLIIISVLLILITPISAKKDNGICEQLSPVDVYLLVPTSAHVDKTRLAEVKKLINSIFNDQDFSDTEKDLLRVTGITYKKIPNVAFDNSSYINDDINDFRRAIDSHLVIRARAAAKETPPTFATEGLRFFKTQYEQDRIALKKRKGVPTFLLFFVIESLNRGDLANMASTLVQISSQLDVFSFIFIGNRKGQQSSEVAKFSLPHSSWNALAVDDNSDIQKYKEVLRQAMCRTSNRSLCMMLKDQDTAPAKTESMDIIQRAAVTHTATNNRPAKPDKIVVVANACCNELIFAKPYDNRVQKCCSGDNVVEIDEDC